MLFEKALIFLFGKKCLLCGKQNEHILCSMCFSRINILYARKTINFKNKNLDLLIYFFKYEKIIRKLILQIKFFNKPYLVKVFLKILLKNENLCGKLKFYDIIIPVPMHKEKQIVRGYNQTELLAYGFAKSLNIKYEKKILIKDINTKRQSSLTGIERYKNVNNAFKVLDEHKIKGKYIILVDDIYTTGATLEECAKVLKKAGAKKICGIVIAKD